VKKKKKAKRIWLWLILICGLAGLAGFCFTHPRSVSKIFAHVSKLVSPSPGASDRHPSQAASSKSATVNSITGKFTFFPDHRDRYAWSVKYPDGQTFNLGEEFSTDCPPVVGRSTSPATIRIELNQQRSCKSGVTKPIEIAAESMKDVSGDGSPEVVATILTGGNVDGHASSLIALTPKGPKVIRRLD
jgi:hypothetical protein